MTLELASLFQDGAILQRDRALPVWGRATPLTVVRGELAGIRREATSGADGRFRLWFPALPAGGPCELRVSAGQESVHCRDLYVGEVWLASGQSNMEMLLEATGESPEAALAGVAETPPLRIFRVDKLAWRTREHVGGAWLPATRERVAKFSAAAFHFARRLQSELGVPIGIIDNSWGGTCAESWTSREALLTLPEFAARVRSIEQQECDPAFRARYRMDCPDPEERFALQVESVLPRVRPNLGVERGWAQPDFDDSAWPTMSVPGTWQSRGERYCGILWFRKRVRLPESWRGRELELHLGAVDKQDVSYGNGVELGHTGEGLETECWNRPRCYAVSPELTRGEELVLAVRADSFRYDGGLIGPAEEMKLVCGAESLPLTGDWRYATEYRYPAIDFGQLLGGWGLGEANTPGLMFESMLLPLVPYALRGVIWYQGEANAGDAARYRVLMRTLISDWRLRFGQGALPFIQVQLAGLGPVSEYSETDDWPKLREAQRRSADEVAAGGAVTAFDLGDELDIHPRRKREVGERLARWALSRVYGRNVVPTGPVWRRAWPDGNELHLEFDCAAGLTTRDGLPPATLRVAGMDGKFYPARARIVGETLVVLAPEVPYPVAARYAWSNHPAAANLVNGDGLPAEPFRTDGM